MLIINISKVLYNRRISKLSQSRKVVLIPCFEKNFLPFIIHNIIKSTLLNKPYLVRSHYLFLKYLGFPRYNKFYLDLQYLHLWFYFTIFIMFSIMGSITPTVHIHTATFNKKIFLFINKWWQHCQNYKFYHLNKERTQFTDKSGKTNE